MKATQVLLRGTVVGAAIGTVTGGALGSLVWPLVGTFVGAFVGAPGGLAVGAVNGALLSCFSRSPVPRMVIRTVGLIPWLAVGLVVAGRWTGGLEGLAVLIVAFNVGAACATATYIVSGESWIQLGAGWRRRPLGVVARSVSLTGLVVGGALGGLAGLIIGVVTHWPTAPFAVVEGGIFGAMSGLALGVGLLEATMAAALCFGRASV